jgi:3-deoxy-7-phosphoheptulonate synthase
MTTATDDLRIRDISALSTPDAVMQEVAAPAAAMQTVANARRAIQDTLHGRDKRLAVVVGPCSIHDPKSAMEYAARLVALRAQVGERLELIMRVYFEKPRTTVGWKGLINDPDLDDSFQINKGLRLARQLLADINALGLPAGCEFLDTTTPQYFADLVAWAAIGARTTESQIHREMASGLSCPVGFKNGTSGDVRIALDAVKSASNPHHFLAVTKNGECAIAETTGNEDCHIILRGGAAPNYDATSVAAACAKAEASGVAPVLMIDASHANSGKNPDNQPDVIDDIALQIKGGDRRIFGVMIESHLVGGQQDQKPGQNLTYGQSITDGCLDWDATVGCLETLAAAVATR